mmetsp:Transcript_31144/g.47135  ORF Transcript_31144/g.47135 Transcript_31144/m.47135 type:complete len:294 (-) Transcript_31144:54-935(-)
MSYQMLLIFLSACAVWTVGAFTNSAVTITCPKLVSQSLKQCRFTGKQVAGADTTRLMAMWFVNNGMEEARAAFPLWFFGAAGSGGIARNVIPKTIDEFLEVQRLKDEGTTLEGPTIGLSPLIGYPRDLSSADVDRVVNNPLTVAQITKKYPVPGNFLAAKGYLTYDAFQKANTKANPLTVKAVFDSFGKPLCVEPRLAQQCLDQYKTDSDNKTLKQNLLEFKLNGFAAIVVLLFLLGLADVASATDAYRGWFPDWPGGIDFPTRLLTSEGNPFTIPDYFIKDVPEGYVFVPKS